ncbi:hypothetical protein BD560DRAFT_429743 [Blakeslea trispora]|nr:hypothetical protein BD560DRAFT_429743 [Blakeslea trispora]
MAQPSIEVDENSLNAVTKLPLPQPSKSSAQPTNYWATSASTRTWSKFFFASEVQTLHYQTPPLVHYNESSSFPMSPQYDSRRGGPTQTKTTTTTGTIEAILLFIQQELGRKEWYIR